MKVHRYANYKPFKSIKQKAHSVQTHSNQAQVIMMNMVKQLSSRNKEIRKERSFCKARRGCHTQINGIC